MSIIYYPNRVYKGKVPSIDRVMAKRNPQYASGTQDINTAPISLILHSDENWMVDSINFTFSNNTASRNFSAYIRGGREVVEHLNDYLWFYVEGAGIQLITLTPGFYTGTELAAELQTQLNANTQFSGAGVTFTVVYDSATGQYTITTNGADIGYYNINPKMDFRTRDSIAGHLFGFTATTHEITLTAAMLPENIVATPQKIMDITALSNNIVSDTNVFGLDSEVAIINETASTVDSYYHNYLHVLTMDQALRLASNVGAAVTATYNVIYETIV